MQSAQISGSGTGDFTNGPSNAASTNESMATLPAELSVEELSSVRISEQLGRKFSASTGYLTKETLAAAFDEARKVFPETKLAYKPSGKTTPLAVFMLVGAAPVLVVVMAAIAFGLCWAFSGLEGDVGSGANPNYMARYHMGKLGLLLDLILVIGMSAVPLLTYGFLGKLTKNRNPRLPAILTGVVNVILAIILFVPVWHGETLAPTHISFLFIPVRYVLIVIGGVLGPFISVAAVHHQVFNQRYCEASGQYLKKMRKVGISFDYAENALALLKQGEYVRSVHLPKATAEQLKAKHVGEMSLWWHERASIAFLELEMKFRGELLSAKGGKDFKKEQSWIAYSAELDRGQAEVLAQEMAV